MAISLDKLIRIAAFPEEQKGKLVELIPQMSEEEKYKLTNAAWKSLAIEFQGKMEAGRQKIMDEVILKKREFNENDFQELEASLLSEFAQKLDTDNSKETHDEIKSMIQGSNAVIPTNK